MRCDVRVDVSCCPHPSSHGSPHWAHPPVLLIIGCLSPPPPATHPPSHTNQNHPCRPHPLTRTIHDTRHPNRNFYGGAEDGVGVRGQGGRGVGPGGHPPGPRLRPLPLGERGLDEHHTLQEPMHRYVRTLVWLGLLASPAPPRRFIRPSVRPCVQRATCMSLLLLFLLCFAPAPVRMLVCLSVCPPRRAPPPANILPAFLHFMFTPPTPTTPPPPRNPQARPS